MGHCFHEIKYDGYRLRVERNGDRVRLITKGRQRLGVRHPSDGRRDFGPSDVERKVHLQRLLARRAEGIFAFACERGEIGPDLVTVWNLGSSRRNGRPQFGGGWRLLTQPGSPPNSPLLP